MSKNGLKLVTDKNITQHKNVLTHVKRFLHKSTDQLKGQYLTHM